MSGAQSISSTEIATRNLEPSCRSPRRRRTRSCTLKNRCVADRLLHLTLRRRHCVAHCWWLGPLPRPDGDGTAVDRRSVGGGEADGMMPPGWSSRPCDLRRVGEAEVAEGEEEERRDEEVWESDRERRGRDVEGTTRKKRLFRSCGDPIVGLSGVDHRVSRLLS